MPLQNISIKGWITFLIFISACLAFFKLTKLINIGWDWVLAPIWIPILLIGLFLLIIKVIN